MDAIQLRDSAKQQLEQIKTIETGFEYLSKVKAIETWAKAEKKDAELQNLIAEQKIRTQRILGTLIKEGQQRGEIAKQDTGRGDSVKCNSDGHFKTLSDIGITRNESSTFQKIADLPENLFEKEIATAKDESKRHIELTTSRVLKAAKNYERQNKIKTREPIIPDNVYRIIYADPPWAYNDKQNTEKLGGAKKHYPTMSIKELCDMELPKIEDNAVLFLWVTSPLLEECFDVIRSWGFKYKTSFVWDKVKHNMGHYNSVRHEFLLVCTKGSCTPDNTKLYDSVQSIEKTGHSKKPDKFYEIIETLYPYGNKIELFARNKRDGWEAYGNQL